MDLENTNSTETTKDKLPNNLEGLIESLSAHIPLLADSHGVTVNGSVPPQPTMTVAAVTEVSGLSESSHDSSINSIGYVADVSELNQPNDENQSPVKNPPTSQATPLTPTTNLKMLVAAASSALDRERQCEEAKKNNENDDSSTSRKMKSLALLCKKFLQVADEEIGAGKEFSLEMMATSLGINRRRIYDIINVMEALEMISKQSKNWYLWHGRGNLLHTLAKLKAMVADDPDIKPYLENPCSEKTKETSAIKTEIIVPTNEAEPSDEPVCSEVNNDEESDTNCFDAIDYPFAARSVRYDKSLGVLCQKFVMLFLISQDNEVTLEEAGKILVPDYQDDTIYMALNPPVNPKTKVRRLYDIANILTSLELIKKKVFVGPLHIKKPGYSWSGPSIDEIESAWNNKKQESLKTVPNKAKKSASSRPFLHQYDSQKGTSPFCSPVKVLGGTKFKKSLSFGGTTTSTPRPPIKTPPIGRHSTVLARPLCPKQVDYLREMREFENEMNKHAHRYPHVASVFHEFLQKYQSTLEQTAAANGRFILPKAISSAAIPDNVHQQLQKPMIHSDASACNCGMWESCTTNNSDHVPGHNTISPLVHTTDITTGSMICDTIPSNTFVANLANSILANILGTIQNTATTEQPTTQANNSTVNSTHTTVVHDSEVSNAPPLMEIQNFQEKSTVLSVGSFPKDSFVHVDDLLVKPGSRFRPSNSNLLYGAHINQRPFSAPLDSHNCPVVVNVAPSAVNPNAFLTSHDLGIDKENWPMMSIKCDSGYHCETERSPKRQRRN